jgi:putative ABC transport system ATP-binding protein
MIRLEGICRIYGQSPNGVNALTGVDLSIGEGEFVTIMGPSGSGKSTILNVIGCLDRPSTGRYFLRNQEVSGLNDIALSKFRNEVLGFVFQQFHLLPRLNALKNVLLPLIYSVEYPKDAQEKAAELLSAVGLADKMTSKPTELSGGQQQRVAIARALINDPSVILADEPTGNLDKDSGNEILDIFDKLNQKGTTIIVVTHDSEVAASTKRVIQISDGAITSDQSNNQKG